MTELQGITTDPFSYFKSVWKHSQVFHLVGILRLAALAKLCSNNHNQIIFLFPFAPWNQKKKKKKVILFQVYICTSCHYIAHNFL